VIRVALADDQAMIRAGLRMVLETEPDLQVVAEAADGADALAVTRRLQPDVVLLDIAMPRLLKVSPPEQLVAAIRVVAGGAALLDPAVTTRVIAAFVHQPAPQPPPELGQLTPRELDVLRLLARGLSNAEIADRLTLGEATVKTHVARVLMKLGLRDRVQAVVYAYENGVIRVGA
jgi:DNA-binding NarL/FixJ family response regulator